MPEQFLSPGARFLPGTSGDRVMTVKQQLHTVVDALDDETATEVLAFALRSIRRAADGERSIPIASEPGIDVDR
jgi:hypothetical protein